MLLALDTATRQISLALHDGDRLIAEHTWPSDNQHTVQLLPAIDSLMAQCGVSADDLTAFAVATGPGSYTGLRIGVAAAKAMAGAKAAPLVGVNTLDVTAAGTSGGGTHGGLVAVAAAGRGRVIVRSYAWRKGQWSGRSEMRLTDWRGLIDSLDGAATITGDIDANGLTALRSAQASGVPVTLAPAAQRLRRAGVLAELAWAQLRAADSPDAFNPDTVTPIYVKSEPA